MEVCGRVVDGVVEYMYCIYSLTLYILYISTYGVRMQQRAVSTCTYIHTLAL